MSNRLRLIGVTLTPQFMVDDGENLTPIQVQPFTVPAADWPDVVEKFKAATEQLRVEVEADATPLTETGLSDE